MNRMVVFLVVVAATGFLSADSVAQSQAVGRDSRVAPVTTSRDDLRGLLQRLQRELRAHEAAYRAARRRGDRAAAAREARIIRELTEQIERLQRRLRGRR